MEKDSNTSFSLQTKHCLKTKNELAVRMNLSNFANDLQFSVTGLCWSCTGLTIAVAYPFLWMKDLHI